MMFAIRICGKDDLLAMSAQHRYPAVNFATIRFISPPPLNAYSLTRVPHYIDDLLIICDDVAPWERNVLHQPICFTAEQARALLAFVEKNKNIIQLLIVACEAGISRSAGAAAAIGRIYLGTDDFVFLSERYQPNPHIYRTILKIWQKERAAL